MITVIAGDFYGNRLGYILGNTLLLPSIKSWWKLERVAPSQIVEFKIVTEDNIKTISGTLGWGTAGALALGPVGLLAGLLLGGKKKHVAFFCRFADGRKLMAKSEPFVIELLQARTIHLR